MYLIDTNIVIHARDGTDSVLRKFTRFDGLIRISTLSLAELERGLVPSMSAAVLRRQRQDVILQRLSVLSFDTAAVEAYGRILAGRGRVKSRDFDDLIAAHALSLDAILVTDNEEDFAGIPGLAIENWVSES